MLYGTYYNNHETNEKVLIIFHHSELKEFNQSPLYTGTGGLTIWRIKRLIYEYKITGRKYRISSGAMIKLLKRGIF